MFQTARRKRSRLPAILVLLLVGIMGATCALADGLRFVDPSGSDLNSGLRPETPWRTLTWAASVSPSNTTIRVQAGDYREDTAGYGYLYIDTESHNLDFVADGPVRILADVPDVRVLHLASTRSMSFTGFHFESADSCDFVVTGDATGKRFISCTFTGSSNWAVRLTGGGGFLVDSCDFGLPSAPLESYGLHLSDSVGATVVDSRFRTVDATCLQVERGNSLEIVGNRFGSAEEPLALGSFLALRSIDCNPVLMQANTIHLTSGHGLIVLPNIVDLTDVSVLDNHVVFTETTTRLGISVGSNLPTEARLIGARIQGNQVEAPVGSSTNSNIRVGFAEQGLVTDNVSTGGGNGLVLWSCDGALVSGNHVVGAWQAGIMDRGGHDGDYRENLIQAGTGSCVRILNDPGNGREVDGSQWWHNEFQPTQAVFSMADPVEPLLNGVHADRNLYRLVEHDQLLAHAPGAIFDFWELRDGWGWEAGGEVEVPGHAPLVMDEAWQPSAVQARLNLELSERASGWLAYGAASPTDTVFGGETMHQDLLVEGLTPATNYVFEYRFCDDDGCVNSQAGLFTTLDETAAPELPASPLRLSAPYPNPANPHSKLRYTIATDGPVRLTLHDAAGRELRTLAEGRRAAGTHELTITGRDADGAALPSGVYFVRVESGGEALSRKWVLLK